MILIGSFNFQLKRQSPKSQDMLQEAIARVGKVTDYRICHFGEA